jgi:hypothetical protein
MENEMQGIIIMLASITPKELLVNQLEEAVNEFKDAKILGKSDDEMDDLFQRLAVPCLLILTKINGAGKDPIEMMKRMNVLRKAHDLISPSEG